MVCVFSKLFNLQPLHVRRAIIDVTEMFKTVKGYANCNLADYIPYATFSSTRGHRFKLKHTFIKHRVKKHFLFNRVINLWNCLSDNVFNTELIATFRNKISACMF